MTLSTISTVIASSDSVMAGGTHVLVSRALQGELEEEEALDLKHALIGGFGDSALELARRAVNGSGAMLYVCVNYETREFLASKNALTGEWCKASFEPWRQSTRQWVFESPLLEPGGDLSEPEWRIVDMDGLLDGNAAWDHMIERQRQGRQGSSSVDGAENKLTSQRYQK